MNEVVAEAQPGYFEAPYRSRLEGADAGLSNAIVAFRDGIGPTWGTQEIQNARTNCLENACRFSVRFNDILKVMQMGGTVPFPGIPVAIMTLTAARMDSVAQSEIYFQGIGAESLRIGREIARLEPVLLN